MQDATLDLGVVGNGSFGALIDTQARVVWSCLPSFDGDPAFCALLGPNQHPGGDFGIELEDFRDSEQSYLTNTAILRTVLYDRHGGAVEVIDFAPRWRQNERFYRPVSLIRQVTPLSGSPRIIVRARPLADWGARQPDTTWGSNHIRWLLPDHALRLTTDVPVRFVRDGLPFVLNTACTWYWAWTNHSTARSVAMCRNPSSARATTGANGCATCPFRWNGRTR